MTAPETFAKLRRTLDKGRRPDMTVHLTRVVPARRFRSARLATEGTSDRDTVTVHSIGDTLTAPSIGVAATPHLAPVHDGHARFRNRPDGGGPGALAEEPRPAETIGRPTQPLDFSEQREAAPPCAASPAGRNRRTGGTRVQWGVAVTLWDAGCGKSARPARRAGGDGAIGQASRRRALPRLDGPRC